MAFTAADLATIEQNIAAGALEVRYADGRMVRYPDVSSLIRTRDLIRSALASSSASARPRTTHAYFGRD
jgi:hypothetical protein